MTNAEKDQIQEVAGLMTAIDQMSAIVERMKADVPRAAAAESNVLSERARLTDKMSKDKDFAAIVGIAGGIEALVQKSAETTRISVHEDVKAFMTQVGAVNVLLQNANNKYGKPFIPEKKSRSGANHGTMNEQNCVLATDELTKRGYQNIEKVPVIGNDGQAVPGYFELRAVSADGSFRKGRYYTQILKDWN